MQVRHESIEIRCSLRRLFAFAVLISLILEPRIGQKGAEKQAKT